MHCRATLHLPFQRARIDRWEHHLSPVPGPVADGTARQPEHRRGLPLSALSTTIVFLNLNYLYSRSLTKLLKLNLVQAKSRDYCSSRTVNTYRQLDQPGFLAGVTLNAALVISAPRRLRTIWWDKHARCLPYVHCLVATQKKTSTV